ncbi:MAG: hypothetical protein A2V83_10000 [Nitrospirae bacterium RBG_16_64_22]|nr:MAG: hypothetical protein A2V83_10000 [Nitrospirae bacterium RBG_16_64_22]
MDRAEIIRCLTALAERLSARGIRGDLYLVGGAAMALAFDARHATKDVDAVFAPKSEIYEAAREIAKEFGLPDGWLNDAVKGYIGRPDPAALPVLDLPGLRVMAASARHLLAMKCLAARREDEEDLRFLLARVGIKSVSDAMEIVQAVYPEARIPPRARFMLEEIFGPRGD